MKLTYQTGITTFIQFLLLSFLTLGSQIISVVTTCRGTDGSCIGNLLTSTILYILVAVVFGCIWLIGLAAQGSRNKWLARLLICIEGAIAAVALFSVKLSLSEHKNVLGTFFSFAIAALAVWTIIMAWRLTRSEGGRISPGRRRRHTIS